MQINPPILLVGHCQEREANAAYHPFSEILQSHFATLPPELFDPDTHQFLANFAQLVPELYQVLPDLSEPLPLEPKQEQLRLISNLTQFIRRATQKRPWLILLDDLQWADQASLELLRYLSHHLPALALMIMATCRDDEIEPGHPLLDLWADLSDQPDFFHLPLERLSQTDLGQILTSIWQRPTPAALIEIIYERTEGNPFYVEEVAKGLVDENIITWSEDESHVPALEQLRLPKSVRDAVWRRVDQLSPKTLMLLRQAAVLGQTFRFDELEAISGMTEWEVLEHLDIALVRQLIKEGSGEAQLHFSHGEIRQVIYSDMGVLRRRLLHYQAGEALERRALPEPERIADKLAYHFSEAGEFERALVYSIQAAGRAELAWANVTAIHWYRQTLTLLDQLEGSVVAKFQPLRFSTCRRLGRVLTVVGRYEEALNHYISARSLLEDGSLTRDQQRQLADLYGQMAEVYEKRSQYDEALAWVKKGLGLLSEIELTPEMARLYLMGAQVFDQQCELDEATAWCQQSLTIASQIKTDLGRQILAQAYTRLSSICLMRGQYELVTHFCQESIAVYHQLTDLYGQVNAYNNQGLAYFYLGNWAGAGQAFDQSLNLARQLGSLDGQIAAADNVALIHLARREWGEALYLLQQNQAVWRQIGAARNEAWVLSQMAQIHLERADWPEAEAYLNQSQAIFSRIGAGDHLAELEGRWAQFYLKTGALDQALAHIRRSLELAASHGNLLDEGQSHRLLSQIHLVRHELVPAEAALRQSLQILTDLGSRYEIAKTRLALARLAVVTGSPDQARKHLDQARPTLIDLEAKVDLLEIHALEQELT
jgi:tetratricopeptide (TPR) repeat protein